MKGWQRKWRGGILALAILSGCPEPQIWNSAIPLVVRVTGDEFRWEIEFPGPDGVLDTPDDVRTRRELHLPAGHAVKLELRSADYVYSFHLPNWDLVEVAVPDSPVTLPLAAREAGVFDMHGSQMCGFTHDELLGTLVVEPAASFDAWLRTRKSETR